MLSFCNKIKKSKYAIKPYHVELCSDHLENTPNVKRIVFDKTHLIFIKLKLKMNEYEK